MYRLCGEAINKSDTLLQERQELIEDKANLDAEVATLKWVNCDLLSDTKKLQSEIEELNGTTTTQISDF